MSSDLDFDENVSLEDAEIFDTSLYISGGNSSNENTTDKDAIVALLDDTYDLFNSSEECGDQISAGLATRIYSACTKKPAKEKFLKIQKRYLHPRNWSFLLAPKVWDDLSDNAKGRELGLQSLQKLFVKSFYSLDRLANKLIQATSISSESIPHCRKLNLVFIFFSLITKFSRIVFRFLSEW
jgi:hypothetical protein